LKTNFGQHLRLQSERRKADRLPAERLPQKEHDQKWIRYFEETLYQADSNSLVRLQANSYFDAICKNCTYHTEQEIATAIASIKNNNAAYLHGITAEILTQGQEDQESEMTRLSSHYWKAQHVPDDVEDCYS